MKETMGLIERKCAQCGRTFEARMEWAYKITKPGSICTYFWFCRHKCIRAYEREHTKPQERPTKLQEAILERLEELHSLAEVAREFGVSYKRVQNIRDKWGKAG